MAGEDIIKLLREQAAAVRCGKRYLCCYSDPVRYLVLEKKGFTKKTTKLIETTDEALACKTLKGE